jgi:hypothetical protein
MMMKKLSKDMMIINIYIPNVVTLNFIKQILLGIKGQIGADTTVI